LLLREHANEFITETRKDNRDKNISDSVKLKRWTEIMNVTD
jgi:hypothetical protein